MPCHRLEGFCTINPFFGGCQKFISRVGGGLAVLALAGGTYPVSLTIPSGVSVLLGELIFQNTMRDAEASAKF